MEVGFVRDLFLVLIAASIGGISVKFLKLQPLVGYIFAGVIFGAFFAHTAGLDRLAEIGTILLLFSIGIELSFKRLGRVLKAATLGAVLQMVIVSLVSFGTLSLFGFSPVPALVLSLGFSLSSTAVVVKILADRGETDTIHGEVMVGWLLVQDLAVIPIMVLLPVLAKTGGDGFIFPTLKALLVALVVVVATVFLGRKVAPYLIHKVASFNSRELLVIFAVALALGTAYATSFFGISPALGAFLAGLVISETQENHAVFAETRPLRDLFVALFFVTLGFLVSPSFIASNIVLILALSFFVIVVKSLVVLFLSFVLKYHGKTAIAMALGLSQIGEFSFVIYSFSRGFNLISPEIATVGIATTLVTLVVTPLLFRSIIPLWRETKKLTGKSKGLNRFFVGWDKTSYAKDEEYKNHIIICGYGRVGKWVGKALGDAKIPFIVVDYSQEVVQKLKREGKPVIYGDPAEPEVLDQAGIINAKAVVVAIPDRVSQEELITHIQTISPEVKVVSRAHFDEDVEKLELLKVTKVVQPEFEASVAIVRTLFQAMGKRKEEVRERLANLRRSRALTN